jgi:hypothetical protein
VEELGANGVPRIGRQAVAVAEAAHRFHAAGEKDTTQIEHRRVHAPGIDAVDARRHEVPSERMKRQR